MTDSTKYLAWRKRVFFVTLLAGITCVVGLGIAELFLRVAKIPGVAFDSFYYDDLTGYRYYPGTTNIYRNDRDDYVERRVNLWGYLDREHSVEKTAGTLRIGFFGDSFTEARQVPFENTFVHLIERDLNAPAAGRDVECLAIAMSGYGTLQSYLEYTRWADSLDLDWVVYVFCENDPSDHVPVIERSDGVPFPVVAGDSFQIDFSFRERNRRKLTWWHRGWQYLKSHSLVVSTLQIRLNLLRARGVKLRVSEADRQMTDAGAGGIPGSITVPSVWPDSLRAQATAVTGRVLDEWRRDAAESARHFSLLYIPRQSEMAKPPRMQDSWASWLFAVCERDRIDVIDPSRILTERKNRGQEVYYDHLTREGHEGLAEAFMNYFDNTQR